MADYIFLKKNGQGEDIKISRDEFGKNPNAYRDYTVRMVDKDGTNYDVPFQHISNAVKDGAHVFRMRDNAPKSNVAQQAMDFVAPNKRNPQGVTPKFTNTVEDKEAEFYSDTDKPIYKEVIPEFGSLDIERANRPFFIDAPTKPTEKERNAKEYIQSVDASMKKGVLPSYREMIKEAGNRKMNAVQQMQDQLDYIGSTGKALSHEKGVEKVMDKLGIAPVVARDEYGKPLLDDKGQILKGTENNEVKANLDSLINQDAKKREEGNYKKTIDEQLRDLYKQKEEIEKKKGRWVPTYSAGFGAGVEDSNQREYKLILDQIDSQIRSLEAVRDKDSMSTLGSMGRALENTAFNPKSWDLGVSDLALMGKISEIKDKTERGEQLTENEKTLAESYIGAQYAAALEDEEMGNAYRWTKIAGESLPFMADFYMTGGYSSLATRGARTGLRLASKMGAKGLKAAVLKNTGVLLGDVAGAYGMALTTQGAKTAADVIKTNVGDMEINDNGEIKFKGGKDALTSLYVGTTKAMVENYTEKLGEHLSFDVPKFFKTAGMENVSRFFTNLQGKNWFRFQKKILEKFGVQNVFSEILEEEAAIPLHALLSTGDSQWSDLIDPKVQADIIGGMVLSVGAMQGAAVAIHSSGTAKSKLNYRKLKNKLNDADWAAENFFREDWGAWKNEIDNTENKDMPMKRLSIKINPYLSEPEKEAVLNYIDLLTEMRGFNLGQNAAMQNKKPLQIRSEIRNINENSGKDKFAVSTFDENGNLVERKKFADEEEANMYKQKMDDINNDNKLKSMYDIVKSGDMTMVETFANDIGISVAEIESIMNKPIYSRTDEEQDILDYLSQIINPIAYPPNVVDEEKAAQDGTELAGTSEVVNANDAQQINERQAAAINKWNEIIQRQPDIDQLITSMQERGYSNNDIAQRLLEDYGSEDITNAFCELCNSSALKDAYINKVGENIDNAVEQHVSEAMFAGQVNGQEDKSNIYQFTDGTNTLTLVGGNVTNENGEFSSDGLIVLRDNNGNFVQRDSFEGLSLQGVVPVEQYRQNLLTPLQENATEVIMATEYNDSDMETSQPVAQESNGLTVPEQKTEEAPMPEVPTSNVQEQSEQKQDYPRDENNNLIYDQVPLEVTINDLYDGSLSDEEIRSLVGNNVSNAQKEYEKVQKKAPKIGTDKNKYLEEQKKHKSTVEEAKRKLDYWQTVDDYIKQHTHTTEAEIQKAKDELSGATAQAEYEKNKSDVKSPVQVAGAFIKNAKIQPESFKKETGYGVTEQRAFSTMISNNGKTIDQLAEDLVSEDNSTNNGAMFHNDTMEAKNAIIEALQGGRQNLGKNTTDDFKEFERNRIQEREDYYQERYGMSYEDFLAFEEQMMPSVWQKMSNFVPEEYDRIVAESYEMQNETNNVEQINNEENGNNTEANEQLAGGTEILPKEGSNQQGGTTVGANERREDENGGEGSNQDGEIQGGAQGVNILDPRTMSDDEKQRRGEMLRNAPVVDVEKEVIVSTPELTARKAAEKWWDDNVSEPALYDTEVGEVEINRNSIEDSLAHRYGQKKLDAITSLIEGFENAIYLGTIPDTNARGVLNHYFAYPINYDGELNYVFCRAKQDANKNRLYVHEVFVSDKIKKGDTLQTAASKPHGGISLYRDILANVLENSLLPNSSDVLLAENQNGLPDLLPSQESNESFSEGKDTTISDTNQENQQKIEEKVEEQPKDDIDAEIKKDIEDFIAESTHDVQITEYEDYEAKISVDGKPSNIVVTPPMENEEKMHAEYRPTEGSYQELGDLLDEYNKTVDPNQQGLAGEHLAAIFTSVDAAIAFGNWLNEKNGKPENDVSGTGVVDGKQTTLPTITEQDINADEIADENAKELAKDFLRGENTGTIAELFYREIAARVQKKGEKKEKKDTKKDVIKAAQDSGKLIIGDVPESRSKTTKQEKKSDTKQAFDEFKDVMKKFRNAGRIDANVSLVGLNARQIEMLADVFRATAKLGYAMVKDGATMFNDWLERMKAMVGETIKENSPWNDQDITDLLTETWNNKYLVDGVRKPLSEWAAEEAGNAEQEQKKQEQPKEEQKAERTFVSNVTKMLEKALETGEKPYKSILDLRKAAKEAGMEVDDNGKSDIKLQELVEDALVSVARNIMDYEHIKSLGTLGNNFSKSTFERIKKLYELQPTISQRSSERVRLQQYSTPLPMAFVADMFIMKKLSPMFFNVLEPTAGNGMLVFGIPSRFVHANEIDKDRLENLRGQNFKEVTEQDATQPFEGGKIYNAVIANPPFGSAEAKNYDGKEISGLDPQISINALESMRDKGRAAIIIGGKTEFRENGAVKNNVPFLTYLYDHYNVVGVVDMDGQLYAKQGTTYPTRMILINGRRSEEERAQSTVYPPVKDKWTPTATTFDELYDIVDKLINSKQKTNGTELLRTGQLSMPVADRPSGKTDMGRPTQQFGEGNQEVNREQRGLDSRPENVLGEPIGRNRRNRRGTSDGRGRDLGLDFRDDEPMGGQGSPSSKSKELSGSGRGTDTTGRGSESGTGVSGRVDSTVHSNGSTGTGSRAILKKEEKRGLDTEKLPYRPHNSAFSLESVAPSAMVEAMDNHIKQIEKEEGNIDEFVTKELGYKSVDEMHNALAAEQVDSVAMAIYQMKKGQAMIIGDQTGVGKGRQMAALIRWATMRGKKPVFITKDANLFTDIYRDLVDIGSGELRPFIFNAYSGENPGVMLDSDGNIVYKALSNEKQKKILEGDELPEEYDYAVLSYSQVNSGDEISAEEQYKEAKKNGSRAKKKDSFKNPPIKARFLRKIAKDNYLLLDESHTAAGESNTGYYLQSLVKAAKGVTFASATFAKRPDTMPIYALKTAMSKANIAANDLIGIIKKGGVTLQEIMSRALTAAGQMVRRERDMTGVVTDWETISDEETIKYARENYDKSITAFNAIIDFQEMFVTPAIDTLDKKLAVMAQTASTKKGTKKMGIDNPPFVNKAYTYTKQLMLTLKAKAIVDRVEKEIKEGKHPVIALESTMESALENYSNGEIVTNPTFAECLKKGLRKVLEYTVKEGGSDKGTTYSYKPEDLGPDAAKAYYKVEQFINESTKDVFISPLDLIMEELRKRGYKVGELTGRKQRLEKDENGQYRVVERTKKEKDKKRQMRLFNNGELDVLILNKSASTGVSLHSSKRFKDQRQRSMIIAQPLSDINDYMQMIGRIDRTGQVHRGYYINLGLPVPAENRFLMMLSTKLKSLNANTTTSQDSESSNVEAPDILNKYGSQVVVEYLKDNPDVYVKLGEPLSKGKGPVSVNDLENYISEEEDARKITGRVALLSSKEQEDFYNDVVARYNALINYLNETGSNDLKITVLPLRAKTLEKKVSSPGIEPNGNNPFAKDAYLEKVEMDVLRKPMKASEVNKTIDNINKGKQPEQALKEILDTVEKETEERFKKEEERMKNLEEKSKQNLAKQVERIYNNDKLDVKQKAEKINEITNESNEKLTESRTEGAKRINDNRDMLNRRFKMFTVGNTYLIPDDLYSPTFLSASPAIFCGYKTKKEGVTLSTSFAVFAVLDGRRRIEIKLSDSTPLSTIKKHTEDNFAISLETSLDNWDSAIPSSSRKEGYILTGNILQAVNDSQREDGGYTGQLISYTDIDGNVKDGILMPDSWNPSMMANSGYPISSELINLREGKEVKSKDGKVEIKKGEKRYGVTYYQLRVPKSKKEGAKFYQNEEILSLVEDRYFYQNRGMYEADVESRNLEKLLDVLSRLGVKVDKEETNTSKTNFGTKYSEDNTINEQDVRSLIEEGYSDEELKSIPYSSFTRRDGKRIIGLKEYIKLLENEKNNILDSTNSAIHSVSTSMGSSSQNTGEEMGLSGILPRGLEERIRAAKAESERRISVASDLKQKYNIDKNGNISADDLLKMFQDFTDNKDDIELLKSIMSNTSNLGIDFKFNYTLSSANGAANAVKRTVVINMDMFSRGIPNDVKAATILHEMIHQQTQIAIGLYQSKIFRPLLNPTQLKALSELEKIFKAVQEAAPKQADGRLAYGATDMHEMIAELSNPEFRNILDSIKYDSRSILQRIVDWFISFFTPVKANESNALQGAQKSLKSLIENYNPFVDTVSRKALSYFTSDNENFKYSEVENKETLDKLNSEPKVKVYRAMQVIDGKLYPPMAAKINGSLVEPTKIGEWYQADEHPELIVQDGTYKDGTPKYKFKLDKGVNDATGKKATDVAAAYNPYWHTSRSPINDQFKSAWIRPNLVTVEVEVPESELTSGYKAQYAKNAVGEVEWKSGSVSSQLAKHGNPRKVILSRYNRVVRVVPVDEVADRFKEMLDGTGIEIPENTVTPQLRAALEAKGVKIGAPEKGVNKNAQIEEALAKGLETDNTVLFRKNDLPVIQIDDKEEWATLNSAIHTKNKIKKNSVITEFTANNYYICTYKGDGFFDINYQIPLDDNSELIDYLEKTIKNGNIRNSENIASAIDEYWHGQDKYHNNNAYAERRRGGYENAFGDNSSEEADTRRRTSKLGSQLYNRPSAEEQEKLKEHANELISKLNANDFVDIVTSDQLTGEQAKAKGFFNLKTGRVTIVLDNNHSKLDIEETILHEIIGHKGLRGLLGYKEYRKLFDAIWSTLTDEQKSDIKEKAMQNGWKYYTAMDEYLAEQAEKMAWDKDSHTLWQNIRHYVTEALRKLGFMIMPNYKDVRYWLWLSYNNLKSDDVMSEMKRQALIYKLRKMPAPKIEWDVNYKDYTEPDILEREGDYSNTGTWQAIEERLTNNAQYWKESFIDYMNAYKIFQDEMAKGINGPLLDNMNAYIGENQISSKIAELQDQFLKNDVKKMQEQVNSVASEFGTGEDGIRGVEQYLYMKHGLERNRVLFMRDWFKENIDKKINDAKELPEMAQEIYDKMVASIETRFEDGDISEEQKNRMLDNAPQAAWIQYVNEAFDGFSRLHHIASTAVEQGNTTLQQMYNDLDTYINDYADFDADKMDKSGISSMTEYYVDGKFSDNAIIEQVESIERMLGDRRKKLWEAVNTVTQKGLDYDYMSGIVGEEAYNRAKSMFRWYVPLRGFEQKTMEDQYNYMQNSEGIGKKSLVTANGRTTLARSPLSVATDMALSAIRRGEINMNKQRAYRLVNRWQKENPDALAPATVVDVWYEVTGTDLNNNPTIEMAVPNITDDMDAEQIREAIIDFNEEMRSKYAKGLAMKDKIPASFVRPFESNNHKNEHIVFVYLNGRQKMIVFNGNPRPAQALNGELKPTSSDGVIKKTMRVMAAAFTSYNPTFVVTNLSRDTIFANNNIAIKESYRYWKKFTGNQAKLIGGLSPNLFRKDNTYNKLWSDYNKGIEPTTELGRYFVEFMQNGGKTGFVNQMKIEELEKMIYSGDKKSAAVRGLSWVAGIIENMNDRVENVNRFAAYVTSRQMGRSVMRSISDAKEASVNFNRKGAGKSTGNGENPSKAAKLAGSIGNAFRSNYLFFNAGVQSFYTLARNTNKFPFKTSAFAMGVPFILGSFMIPLLNKIIGSLVGDDGDDEYANIPEWTRRNNICIYCGGGKWAKIPLPIELRAFYGLGDIAAGYTFDERLKSTNPLPIDMTSQLSQILPLDFMGEGGNVLGAFVPDVVKPITQIMTNTDWTGKPIQKATTPFNQYDPEYTKAFKYEFEPFVDFSKWINNHTGGTDVSKGWYDGWWNSPAYWNHLIGAYGGGFMQDLMRFGKLGKRAVKFDWEDASMKEVPIFKAMFETPTERTQYYRVMNKFQMYRDEAAKTKHDLNKWKKSEDPLLKARYDHDTYEATKTNEVKRMELVDKYLKEEKRLTKLIENKKTSESVKKAKKEELTRKKIDLVNQLDQIE